MILILIFTISIFIIVFLIFLLIILTKKCILNYQKLSPFECGFNPISYKRLPFSIHFFIIAIIFLIFDIEIIIILPSILRIKISIIKYWIISSFLFILILIVGLYYEWWNGLLTWQK